MASVITDTRLDRTPGTLGEGTKRGELAADDRLDIGRIVAARMEKGEGMLLSATDDGSDNPASRGGARAGDVRPKTATRVGVLRRGLALGLVALSALVFAVPTEAQTVTVPGVARASPLRARHRPYPCYFLNDVWQERTGQAG